MTVDDRLIAHLEGLARLSLSAGERESVKKNLTEILACLDTLAQIDTVDIVDAVGTPNEALPSSLDALRADSVADSLPRDQVLQNAPAQKDGYFRAPKTVE